MIPKIIHYCWFGGNPKSAIIENCINSWKEKCPDYQIIEWKEDNFDVNCMQYVKDAYEAKKWAFVSDVCRVKALYEYGGIYMDTDVEVYKSFDTILNNQCVLGFEEGNYVATSFMASMPHFSLFENFYNLYKELPFYDEEGKIITGTNVTKLTNMLLEKGLIRDNSYQEIEGISIYPQEYFSPYDYGYETLKRTENSICVHYFIVSWLPKRTKIYRKIKKYLAKCIGINNAKKIVILFSRNKIGNK